MRSLDEIYKIAEERKGREALENSLSKPKTIKELEAIPDDRWLSAMAKGVFQAGFNWKVVESMWPGFETAFNGFDIGRCAMLHDEDFERLVSDTRIVRHGTKIKSVQQNAVFVSELIQEEGSAGKAFIKWPQEDYIGLLQMLKKRGSRLGGMTAQYFLRRMGIDSFILSRDVTARLITEGIIDKQPSSQKAMTKVQEAFNEWHLQSGRSFTEISRILAMSIDG